MRLTMLIPDRAAADLTAKRTVAPQGSAARKISLILLQILSGKRIIHVLYSHEFQFDISGG